MKYLYFLTFLLFISFYCNAQTAVEESTATENRLIDQITEFLNGEFDNFQQAWQENTKEGLHKVETEHLHQHIHSKYTLLDWEEKGVYFKATHSGSRDTSNVLQEEIMRFWEDEKTGVVCSETYPSNGKANFGENSASLGKAKNKLTWARNGENIEGKDDEGVLQYTLSGQILSQLQPMGIFQNKSGEAYRLMKCRFFSGWIQYPLPDIPDSTFMMRNLKIHDQGGMQQLFLADGTPIDYTIELTQLVYGKRISIMKLAIYDMPKDSVDYNSRSISYTWTNPEAKRIGVNLRKIGSGLTLIEPNYMNSNNTKFKK